jgi:hypothetical protein
MNFPLMFAIQRLSSCSRDVVPDPLSDLIISDDSDDDKVSKEALA